MEPITLAVHAGSLGDIESLIVYNDDSVKEMAYYPEIFKKGFFRFSVGLGDANDLIADLQQAFEKAGIA